MSDSVWTVPAEELLRRTASTEPTPGSGSIAAVAGAFGIGLVQKALAITDDAPAALSDRGEAILARAAAAADGDVAAFAAVIDAPGEASDADHDEGQLADVLAGADLIRGAARAALRAVDLDLHELEDDGSDAATSLRARRDDLVARLEADA